MVNQWGRDGNFSSGGSRSTAGVLIPVIVALIIGAGGGYAGARFLSGVSSSEIEARDRTIAELQQTLSDLKFDSADTAGETDALRSQIRDREAEIAALQSTIEEAGDAGRMLEQARKSQKVSELQIIELESELKQMNAQSKSLRAQLEQKGGNDDAAMTALNEQIKQLEQSLEASRKQAAEAPRLKQQVAELQAQIASDADKAASDARKKILALDKQKAALESQLAKAEARIAELGSTQKKVAALEAENRQLEKKLADATLSAADATSASAASARMKVQVEQMAEALANSDDALRAANKKIDAMASAKAQREAEIDTLAARIAQLEAAQPVADTKVPEENGTDPAADSGLTPRDRADVERAVDDLPGIQALAAAKRQTMIDMLVRGECVTDALKAAFGHVSAVALRNLFRELGGSC